MAWESHKPHQHQHLATKSSPAADAHRHGPAYSPAARRNSCKFEEFMGMDHNVSACMLVALLGYVEMNAAPDWAQGEQTVFRCPLISCDATFENPAALADHLPICERLRDGRLYCDKCGTWHGAPPKGGIMKRLSDSLGRLRSPRRSGGSSYAPSSVSSRSPTSPADRTLGLPEKGWRYQQALAVSPQSISSPQQQHPAAHGPIRQELMDTSPMELMDTSPLAELDNSAVIRAELMDPMMERLSRRYRAELIDSSPGAKLDYAPVSEFMVPLSSERPSSGLSCTRDSFDTVVSTNSSSSVFSRPSHSLAHCVSGASFYSAASSHASAGGAAFNLQIPGHQDGPSHQFCSELTNSPVSDDLTQNESQKQFNPACMTNHADASVHNWRSALLANATAQVTAAEHAELTALSEHLATNGIGGWIMAGGFPGASSMWRQHQHQIQTSPSQRLHHDSACLQECDYIQPAVSQDPCAAQPTWVEPETTISEMHSRHDELSSTRTSPPSAALRRAKPDDYKCDEPGCDWRPRAHGKPENFANYLRKHKQTHLGFEFPCIYAGCERAYTRLDNLNTHINAAHRGNGGSEGRLPPYKSRAAAASKRRRAGKPEDADGPKIGRQGAVRRARTKRMAAMGPRTAREGYRAQQLWEPRTGVPERESTESR